jgi:hypothetical protein
MSPGPRGTPQAQSNFWNSPASMPMIARMFRKVPLAMPRPAWTGMTTVRRSGWRIPRWLPLILTTVKPARSSALTTVAPEWPGGTRASGDVEGQRQLIRRADLGEQRFQPVPQVGNRGFRRRTVAYRPDARAQLCGGAPDTGLVLFHDVRHTDYAGHNDSPTPWSAPRISAPGRTRPASHNRRRAAAGWSASGGLSSRTGSARYAAAVLQATETGSGRLRGIPGRSQ